jgi:hypothetical protein
MAAIPVKGSAIATSVDGIPGVRRSVAGAALGEATRDRAIDAERRPIPTGEEAFPLGRFRGRRLGAGWRRGAR